MVNVEQEAGVVVVEATFAPGEEVRLESRYGDFYAEGEPVATAVADERGTVRFEGVRATDSFWAVGPQFDGRRTAQRVTAKAPAQAKAKLSDEEVRARLAQTVPTGLGNQNPVQSGARGSDDLKFGRLTAEQQQAIANSVRPDAHEPTRAVGDADPRTLAEGAGPFPKQADVVDVPQSSATAMGQATPVAVAAPIRPSVKQEAAADIPQSSATELGAAAPIEPVVQTGGEAQHRRDRVDDSIETVPTGPVDEQRLPAAVQDATGRDVGRPDADGEGADPQGESLAQLEELSIWELRGRAKAAGVSAGGGKSDIAQRLLGAGARSPSVDVAPGTAENAGLVEQRGLAEDAAAAQIAGREVLAPRPVSELIVPSDPIANPDGSLRDDVDEDGRPKDDEAA